MSRNGLSEAHIERQISDWLALDGWRAIKTEASATSPRGGKCEAGTPDVLYIRYSPKPYAEVMWIEHKAGSRLATEIQHRWHAKERVRGALVVVANEDFPASLEGFHRWYRGSGLLQREGL